MIVQRARKEQGKGSVYTTLYFSSLSLCYKDPPIQRTVAMEMQLSQIYSYSPLELKFIVTICIILSALYYLSAYTIWLAVVCIHKWYKVY